jgi:hypothetical protein
MLETRPHRKEDFGKKLFPMKRREGLIAAKRVVVDTKKSQPVHWMATDPSGN